MGLEKIFEKEIQLIEAYLNEQFPQKDILHEAVNYSLLSGGKRFRPALSLLTAQALGQAPEVALPFGCAVEFIHTYSLIHDDLPAMDDDDERRGKPSNHKKYGEAMAILAGDGLLTDAFRLISTNYANQPERGLRAVTLLSEAAGLNGMVGGQVIDIEVAKNFAAGRGAEGQTAKPEFALIEKLHAMKTGALIRVAAEGAALLCGANETEQEQFRIYGANLGYAFQIADDLLDHEDESPEAQSVPGLIGVEKSRELLNEVTNKALKNIESYGSKAEALRAIAIFNRDRLN